MKKALFMIVLAIAVIIIGHYFFTNESALTEQFTQEEPQEEYVFPMFDFSIVPPAGWEIWSGMSAHMSSFAANDRGIDPYDIEAMQAYVNNWTETETDVLVYAKEGTVDTSERDYVTIVETANAIVENPLQSDDVRMVLYDIPIDFAEEPTTSEVHTRRVVTVAARDADFFRVTSPQTHDSVNLSIPYGNRTITFYKNVAKDMTDDEVISVLEPFVAIVPLTTESADQ